MSKNRDTYMTRDTDHMIKETIVMMISLRMLKKSHMTFPRSPIRPMQIPKVMKKPIKPGGRHGAARQEKTRHEVANGGGSVNSPRTFMPHLYSSFFLLTNMGSVWFWATTGAFFRTVWTWRGDRTTDLVRTDSSKRFSNKNRQVFLL